VSALLDLPIILNCLKIFTKFEGKQFGFFGRVAAMVLVLLTFMIAVMARQTLG
jgi:hypothetical protein